MKKADRNLVVALITCLLTGTLAFAFSLHIYFRHDLRKDFDKPMPVEVIQPLLDANRAYVYVVLPAFGVICFLVGYAIWDYRRKRGAIKEPENSNA